MLGNEKADEIANRPVNKKHLRIDYYWFSEIIIPNFNKKLVED